jgi:excisionase family DNA binding protein
MPTQRTDGHHSPARLLPIPKAAAFLSISPRTVRALIAQGELRVVRVSPHRVAIEPEELARYVAARRS